MLDSDTHKELSNTLDQPSPEVTTFIERRKKSKIFSFLKNSQEEIKKWWHGFQIKAFWILFLILIGFGLGLCTAKKISDYQIDKYIKLGNFIHQEKIYDLKERMK